MNDTKNRDMTKSKVTKVYIKDNRLPNKILLDPEVERVGDLVYSGKGVVPLVLVEFDFSFNELCLELVEACWNNMPLLE